MKIPNYNSIYVHQDHKSKNNYITTYIYNFIGGELEKNWTELKNWK